MGRLALHSFHEATEPGALAHEREITVLAQRLDVLVPCLHRGFQVGQGRRLSMREALERGARDEQSGAVAAAAERLREERLPLDPVACGGSRERSVVQGVRVARRSSLYQLVDGERTWEVALAV